MQTIYKVAGTTIQTPGFLLVATFAQKFRCGVIHVINFPKLRIHPQESDGKVLYSVSGGKRFDGIQEPENASQDFRNTEPYYRPPLNYISWGFERLNRTITSNGSRFLGLRELMPGNEVTSVNEQDDGVAWIIDEKKELPELIDSILARMWVPREDIEEITSNIVAMF